MSGMRRCSCCKNWWPLECFSAARRRTDGTAILRARCEACRKRCGTSQRHKVEVQRQTRAAKRAGVHVQSLRCSVCSRAWDRPRALGRPPARCPDCVRIRTGVAVHRRIVLGPVHCQSCRVPVTWNGWGWEEATGDRHRCVVAA